VSRLSQLERCRLRQERGMTDGTVSALNSKKGSAFMNRVSEFAQGKSHRVGAVQAMAASLSVVVSLSFSAMALPSDGAGQNTFNSMCASCHGQNGAGTPTGKSLNAPDLGSSVVQSRSDAELHQIIADGKNNMPPFKGSLSNDQIESLVKYVRKFSKQQK
jgi:mono/diheme cytochrome c family protein